MQSYFKTLFEYDKWATGRLMEKFEHQFPQNERIYVLLSHMLSAQRIWLDRCLDLPASGPVWESRLPEVIRQEIENYHLAWVDLIDQLQPGDFESAVTYTNSRGETFTNRLCDIITQVTNHGTHHRGQIMMMMKDEGFVLPNIDYISYFR